MLVESNVEKFEKVWKAPDWINGISERLGQRDCF